MNRTLQTILAIALVLGGGLALWKFVVAIEEPPPTAPPRDLGPTPVQVRAVEPQEVVLTVEAYGNLEARRSLAITAEIGGRITRVLEAWRPGARVAAGELLVALDRKPAELELLAAEARRAEAEALVAAAEVDLEGARRARDKAAEQRSIAEREFARMVELADFASDSLRDRAETALVSTQLNEETTHVQFQGATAALEGAKASAALADVAVKQAGDVLERTEIRAPFTGRLRGQAPGLGTMAVAGQMLGELLDTDELVLTLRVPERELLRLQIGMPAEIGFPSDPGLIDLLRVSGAVTGVDPASDPTTRRGTVEIGLAEELAPVPGSARGSDAPGSRETQETPGTRAKALPVGLFARASIEVERIPDAFWISRNHVFWSEEGPLAYVLALEQGRSVARARPLRLAREHGEGFLLQAGLQAGDLLITHPLDRMSPGALVEAIGEAIGEAGEVRAP